MMGKVNTKDFEVEDFVVDMNDTKTVAFGVVKKGKESARINVNVDLLEEAVKLLKTTKYQYIDLVVYGEENAVLFGKKKVGVLLAPRVPNKDDDRYQVRDDE